MYNATINLAKINSVADKESCPVHIAESYVNYLQSI